MADAERHPPPSRPSREELVLQTRQALAEGRRTFAELFHAANVELEPRRAQAVLRELTR